MRLFDGSGEYVPADDIVAGDFVRDPDTSDDPDTSEFREVRWTVKDGHAVSIAFGAGDGFDCCRTDRVLRRDR